VAISWKLKARRAAKGVQYRRNDVSVMSIISTHFSAKHSEANVLKLEDSFVHSIHFPVKCKHASHIAVSAGNAKLTSEGSCQRASSGPRQTHCCSHANRLLHCVAKGLSLKASQGAGSGMLRGALDSWSQDESGIEVLAAVFPPCFKDGQRCHAGNVLDIHREIGASAFHNVLSINTSCKSSGSGSAASQRDGFSPDLQNAK